MAVALMQGSLNSSMGEHLMTNNKLAYFGRQTLPITPDGIPSGAPAVREALSDPDLRDPSPALWNELSYSTGVFLVVLSFIRVIRVFRPS